MLILLRIFVYSFGWALAILMLMSAYLQFISNSRYLSSFGEFVSKVVAARRTVNAHDFEHRFQLLLERALLYENLIENRHLDQGMVVTRGVVSGRAFDVCDSLLFSAIRYVALIKLGEIKRADEALAAIMKSQIEGDWWRHPMCRTHHLSRDMLTGILMIVSQDPKAHRQLLQRLVERIREGGGYFGEGPSYVSYLTPGLGKVIRMLQEKSQVSLDDLPLIIRGGYSTNEWSLLSLEPGYEAHLAALTVWLEMEIGLPSSQDIAAFSWRSLLAQLTIPFSGVDPYVQRYQWITFRLVRIDPRNLFFQYLRLRSIGQAHGVFLENLMNQLFMMGAFPWDRLPNDCDRTADYLWQRRSEQYDLKRNHCTREFSGVDLLWIVGLIKEEVIKGRP